MTQSKTSFEIELPAPEAADLAVQAAKQGVSTPELISYHVLKGAYGVLHPLVAAFDSRPKKGQEGTD
jgi:hypothetical protein